MTQKLCRHQKKKKASSVALIIPHLEKVTLWDYKLGLVKFK